MAGIQFPYVPKTVANDTDQVDEDDHNKQEDQLVALTAERGGTWADDAGRPTPTLDIPNPHGFNETRNSYEFYNGTAWVQTGGALAAHATAHEDGGADEINVGALSGELADPQPPKIHGTDHEPGGPDEVHVAAGSVDILKFLGHKDSPGTINKGQAVYITGFHVVDGEIHVEKAKSDAPGTMPALGIAESTITDAPGGAADVVLSGRITGLDTSMWNEMDSLYVSPTTAGALTNVKPIGPHFIQKIAEVARKDAANGIIIVFGAGRSNAVPNIPQDSLWIGDANGVATIIPIANIRAHAPQAHVASHEGGSDAIAIAGIGGDLVATPRPPTTHKDTHKSGGTDPFTSSDLLEAVMKRIRETGGPTDLLVGAIPDNEVLKRSGSAVVGGGVFGQNSQNAEDLTLSTTTSTTPIQKLRMTTPSLPTGTYRIGWSYSWYFTSGANDFAAQVQVDDNPSLILIQQQEGPADVGTDQRHLVGGFAYITFGTPGTHDVDLDFFRVGGVGTAGIQDARLEIRRES